MEAAGDENRERNRNNKRVHVAAFSPAIFPEEILEKIFSKLSDLKVIRLVFNACPQFNRILSPTIAEWTFDEIFPLIFSELGKQDILSCRLVCKQWTKSIDNYLQALPGNRCSMLYAYHPTQPVVTDDLIISYRKNYPDYSPQYHSTMALKDFFSMTFYDETELREGMGRMLNHPRNPFIFRSIEFCTEADDSYLDAKDYWNEVFRFLSECGHHIWYAYLGPSIQDDRVHPKFNYKVLRNALTLMPNLRTLSVGGFDCELSVDNVDLIIKNQLEDYIRTHPLPDLHYLHSVEELLFHKLKHQPVMNELMRKYSSHLEKVTTNLFILMNDRPRLDAFPHITEIGLVMEDSFQSWRNFCRLMVAPNLVKLGLTVQRNLKISKVLAPLQRAFPSLVYLKLRFIPSAIHQQDVANPEFFLRKVKTLEIFDRPHLQYDQIFSYLPDLEYILVCHDEPIIIDDEDDVNESHIRKAMASRSLYESDIWIRLEHLKEFTVAKLGDTGDTENEIVAKTEYTRDLYQRKIEIGEEAIHAEE